MDVLTTPLDDPAVEELLAGALVEPTAAELADVAEEQAHEFLAALGVDPVCGGHATGAAELATFAAPNLGVPAPGLVPEIARLRALGGTFSGIVGNLAHRYGYHLPPRRLYDAGLDDDYSLRGALNRPVSNEHCCAFDGGMNWPASRKHLAATVAGVRAGTLTGFAEIIGSLDGRRALYWTAARGWRTETYHGEGHIDWSHFAIYRSTALRDHGLYLGWGPNGYLEDDMEPSQVGGSPMRMGTIGTHPLEGVLGSVILKLNALLQHAGEDAVRDAAAAELLAGILAEVDQAEELLAGIPGADPDQFAAAIATRLRATVPADVVALLGAKLLAPAGS